MHISLVKPTIFATSLILCACGGPSESEAEAAPQKPPTALSMEGATFDEKFMPEMKGNSRLFVTISCQRGNLPGYGVSRMPINAFAAVVDEGYLEDYQKRLLAGEEDLPDLQQETGEDGIVDFDFRENREHRVAVAPMDERFQAPISNSAYNRVMIPRGKTVHKDFVLAQAYCDKDRAMQTIDISTYLINPGSFGSDYERTGVAWPNEKQYYWRSSSSGPIKHQFAQYFDRSKPKGFYLDDSVSSVTIFNVQTEEIYERVCAEPADSLSMTVRSDHTLGVQSYGGKIGMSPYQCLKAYATELPVTYEPEVSGNFLHSSQNLRGILDITKSAEFRSTCDDDRLAAALAGPVNVEAQCFSTEIYRTTYYSPSGVHNVARRIDLSKLEEVEGKVP